jgi:hypothetical protein
LNKRTEKFMSTDYMLAKKVSARELFGGQLEKLGIRERIAPEASERERCLTDGRNYLWVYTDDDGSVSCLSRYGADAPGKILNAIAEVFETEIFSEFEPQFWGFDTQEDWDAAMKEEDDRCRQEFYADVCAYVRGEPNDIRPGTHREFEVKIAKKLLEEEGIMIDDKDKLLAGLDAIYRRDHAVVVTLSPRRSGAR